MSVPSTALSAMTTAVKPVPVTSPAISSVDSRVASPVASIESRPFNVPVPVRVRVSVESAIAPKVRAFTPVDEVKDIVFAVALSKSIERSSSLPFPRPKNVITPSAPVARTPAAPKLKSSAKVGESLNTARPVPVSSESAAINPAEFERSSS